MSRKIISIYAEGNRLRPEIGQREEAAPESSKIPVNDQAVLTESTEKVRRGVAALDRRASQKAAIKMLEEIYPDILADDTIPINLTLEEEIKYIKDPYTKTAKELRLHGNFRECVSLLRRGFAEYPNQPRIVNSFGQVAVILERNDIAERFFRHTLRFRPNDIFAIGSLANCLLKRGNLAEAEELITLGLRIDPEEEFLLKLQEILKRRVPPQSRSPVPPRSSE